MTAQPAAPDAPAPDAGHESEEPIGAHGRGDDVIAGVQRLLLDKGPPTCILNEKGRSIYANSAYVAIAEALASEDALPSLISESEWPYTESVNDVIGGQEIRISVEDRVQSFRVRRIPVKDQGNRMQGVAFVFDPITREKELLSALAEATARLEDTTRLVSDWVWETDREFRLTFVSPRIWDALGYQPHELLGRRLDSLPGAGTMNLEERGRVPFRDLAVEIEDKRGSPHLFRLSGLPVYSIATGNFVGLRGTAEDITELRAREQALVKAKEIAELANRSKTEFLANMSHELRTPLNAVIGFAEIMESEILGPLGNTQYKSYATDIHESAQHLLNLINDLLDVAKVEAGGHALNESTVDAAELVENVRRLMAERARSGGLTLEKRLQAGLPGIRADERKMKQVLLNLLSNAVKFTGRDGLVLIEARLDANGDFLFVVSDTGIGMAADDIPRAFSPFEQVDSRLSRQYEGTGLGLPLSDGFIRLHGGTLTLESELGVGTRAIARLPAERVVQGVKLVSSKDGEAPPRN